MSVVPAMPARLAWRWQSFEAWVGTRRSAVALFVLALGVFALQSLFMPVYPGRDMSRYIQSFLQLFYQEPVLPSVINTRGPLASLGVGVPLELGGVAAEVWIALLYASSIVAWGAVALLFGARAAVLTTGLLLVYPGYGILFHELASDALFAAAFAGWAVLLSRAILRPSVKTFLVVGLGMGLLVLVRPGNQVLIVFALLPLLLRAPWSRRLSWVAAFFVASAAVTQGWKAFNELRYGDAVAMEPSGAVLVTAFVLLPLVVPGPWRRRLALLAMLAVVGVVAVKGWRVQNPVRYAHAAVQLPSSNIFLFRAFMEARIVSPENGPASRELARVVQRDLLAKEPYRSYGVDLETFFSSGSQRVFGDMTHLAGVDLAAVTREAIVRHPRAFAGGIARTIWDELWTKRMYAPLDTARGGEGGAEQAREDFVVVNGRRLPRPTDGEPIPSSRFGPDIRTLGGQAREVWRAGGEHPLVFDDPRDELRYEKFERETARLSDRIPTRDGSPEFARRFNQASHAFPPPVAWLALGAVALAVRRPRRALVALAPAVAGLVVIVATTSLIFAVPQYAAPVTPAFLVLAAAGLVGAYPRARPRPTWLRRMPSLRFAGGILAAGFAIAAAAWAAERYGSHIDYRFASSEAPPDLGVFLRAASDVLNGLSPYTFQHDKTYAYPPVLAFLVVPLESLGVGVATLMWTLVSLAAVGAALWLLGVRDWRCYLVASAYPVTWSAINLGTIGPLLLLAVAVAWRWRDHLVTSAAAVGAAVALKLFLWPVAVWLALTRRGRGAVAAAGFALALALVPWAAIGFAGLGDYPGLLRRLVDEEATASYSVQALGVRAHLPEVAAVVLSLLVTAALLVAAARVARDERRTSRGREVGALILALAAALAASPIVWMHYFVLLLVPLALTRPRLSPLWLVPFAYWPLGEAAWPGGDARKLGLALATTLVLVVVTARRGAGDPARTVSGAAPALMPARAMRARLRRAAGLPSRQVRPSP